MGVVAADGTRVRHYRTEVQPQSREDGAVGGVHAPVCCLQRGLVGVERVGIFHDEFTGAHDAEAGPNFVPELGLNLVEVEGQLLVALYLPAPQRRDDFFVGWSEAEITVVTILKSCQLRPVLLPATRFLPQLGGLDHRHGNLQGAGPIHFFPDHLFHFPEHAQAQWHPVINPRGDPANQSRAQHELVTDDLGVRGCFFQGGQQKLTGAHWGKDPLENASLYGQ